MHLDPVSYYLYCSCVLRCANEKKTNLTDIVPKKMQVAKIMNDPRMCKQPKICLQDWHKYSYFFNVYLQKIRQLCKPPYDYIRQTISACTPNSGSDYFVSCQDLEFWWIKVKIRFQVIMATLSLYVHLRGKHIGWYNALAALPKPLLTISATFRQVTC